MNRPAIVPVPKPASTSVSTLADPLRDIRVGLIVAAIFFLGFLGWAAFARLDAAAYAPGTLVVSGQRQSVQHRDGGVVGKIYVREGHRVQRGQLLMTLAAAEVQAQERALASQAIRLLAQRARLEAEQLGVGRIVPPREFVSLSTEDKAEAALAMRLQQTELSARTSVLGAQRDVLAQRAAQSGEQGRGYGEQTVATREQLRILDEQITALKPVADKGFVSKTRMRELERARAELEGQRGQYAASVAQTRGAARESEMQALEAQRSFRERTASDLRDVETALGEILPKWQAARDQLERTSIRAPATGAVVGMTIFTPGGVIASGQKLMDIVPEDEPLLIQARIAPDDADDLTVGKKTLVKFSGLHERQLPNLEGELRRLSADSFADEKTGQSYFTGDIVVPRSQLALIRDVRGKDFELRAGMPVQILIPLRQRTALDYAIEPLVGSFWASFREH
ncbi:MULTISPECIES: HlyD family type I secretion periplasmic adaptor subunit [Sphingobium]|jgi:HlyD family type I secretion membrane fusion protein|uniref:HlyD family type I secretion periplasmic adaptor subunit n=1 Tax=Sphingobium TaxID=165695 RepID=UPI000DBB2D59|nr:MULTISPECIES: HlyD family type I secretion periplasmic adaptor subunit [Sphingobium]KAA9012093.1 HlyD family type I secretion periplasmic adaptor subunit [Sphingobium limneticum]MBU0931608.1 HlyD family type I secretion periplasmic adaptor subunit [Alphaproteobacteria bacterium]BBC99601.1 HlyD family secretion protein [Sphingobium sp. YG1]